MNCVIVSFRLENGDIINTFVNDRIYKFTENDFNIKNGYTTVTEYFIENLMKMESKYGLLNLPHYDEDTIFTDGDSSADIVSIVLRKVSSILYEVFNNEI